jgi:hypothetical protein
MDTCGFEYHSFRCAWCASLLAGIIDPSDGELVLSVLEELEEPSGVTATSPDMCRRPVAIRSDFSASFAPQAASDSKVLNVVVAHSNQAGPTRMRGTDRAALVRPMYDR